MTEMCIVFLLSYSFDPFDVHNAEFLWFSERTTCKLKEKCCNRNSRRYFARSLDLLTGGPWYTVIRFLDMLIYFFCGATAQLGPRPPLLMFLDHTHSHARAHTHSHTLTHTRAHALTHTHTRAR
jgi:hypothetical protein